MARSLVFVAWFFGALFVAACGGDDYSDTSHDVENQSDAGRGGSKAGAAASSGTGGRMVSGGSGGAAAGSGKGGTGGDTARAGKGGAGAKAGAGGAGRGGAGAGAAAAGSGGGGIDAGVQPSDAGSDAGPSDADLTFLSDTDRSAEGVVIAPDRLSAEWLGLGRYGVRSTRAVSPHEGVFYFEAYAALDYFQIGVATAQAVLDRGAGETDRGLGIDVSGLVVTPNDTQAFTPSPDGAYGFVVDYRSDHPTIYVLAGTADSPQLVAAQDAAALDAPLFIHLSGIRRVEGYQAAINPGNDTSNRPFTFDPKALLTREGHADVADALVLGWGATHALALNGPPTLTLGASLPLTAAVGETITVSAQAADSEDGALDAKIAWDVLSTGNGPEHVHGTGPSFAFTPSVLGQHPVRVSVVDAGGKRAEQTLVVQTPGTQPQLATVKLTAEPGLSGRGIAVSDDGLRAHWTENDKYGVRANQGLYGGFWYVEGHRLIPEDNQAIGLVIGGVSLDPYHFNVTPPSCSVNTVGPGIYRDLIVAQQLMQPSAEYYGLAVDYRGDHPTVYVIVEGRLAATLQLTDATVPIYPMLYGNSNASGAMWDMEINFGGSPFHEHPSDVLQAAGIDASGLELCWGKQNAACQR